MGNTSFSQINTWLVSTYCLLISERKYEKLSEAADNLVQETRKWQADKQMI